MAIKGEKKEVIEGGKKKEALTVSFTNGALEQLESLKGFLGTDDPVEVIKAGIAFIQRVKETEGKNPEQETPK